MKKYTHKSTDIRWENKTSEPDENGCINWLGALDKDGYGRIKPKNGKRMRTHRFAYQKHFGMIPEKMFVCHHCDNPSCVTPEHLWLGTAKDNALDRAKKGRGARNNLAGCPMKMLPNSKLSKSDVLEIRKLLESKNTMIHIAHIFNVHKSAIYNIKHGKTWYHI